MTSDAYFHEQAKVALRTSKVIGNVFKPDEKLAKTSMDGRVIYEDIDFAYISGEDMKATGELLAKEFPDFQIWVTGGPYRGYDVRHQVDKEAKIISIDFYSVRPGFSYLKQIIEQIKQSLP